MDKFEALSKELIGSTYTNQGIQSLTSHQKLLNDVMSRKKLPEEGWDDLTITMTLNHLSAMDSNNFINSVGVGEREGRVYSSLVKQRHFGFSHGIGF